MQHDRSNERYGVRPLISREMCPAHEPPAPVVLGAAVT